VGHQLAENHHRQGRLGQQPGENRRLVFPHDGQPFQQDAQEDDGCKGQDGLEYLENVAHDGINPKARAGGTPRPGGFAGGRSPGQKPAKQAKMQRVRRNMPPR
jgi:hypothetical protein